MTAEPVACDTSVAVPLLVASHTAHDAVRSWASGRTLCLSGHALVETYSVLTRLPGDARVDAADAVALINDRFAQAAPLPEADARNVHATLAELGVAGGAAYDGLVALVARAHHLVLATRDSRARATYEAVGVQVEVVGSSALG